VSAPFAAARAAALVEIRLAVRRPATWVLATVAAANAILWGVAGPAAARGWAVNSDFYVVRLLAGFAFFYTPFLTALVMGDSVVRDARCGLAELIAATPTPRAAYLAGKFVGGFAVLGCCYAAFAAVLFGVQWVPVEGLEALPPRGAPFVEHFASFVLVPHFALAALLFAAGAVSLRPRLVFGLAAAVWSGYVALQVFVLRGLGWGARVLFDPFGMNVSGRLLAEAAPGEVDVTPLTFGPELLANRAALVAFGVGVLAVLFVTAGSAKTRTRAHTGAAKTGAGTYALAGPSPKAGTAPRFSLPGVRPAYGRLGCFAAVLRAELRLLAAERGLLVLATLTVAVCVFAATWYGGPSSARAAISGEALAVLLSLAGVYLAGESAHRDDDAGLGQIVLSAPAPGWLLVLPRLAAIAVALGAVACAAAAAVLVPHVAHDATAVRLLPYAEIYLAIVMPAAAFGVAVSAAIHGIARDRYVGHVLASAGVGAVAYLVATGSTQRIVNPLLHGLWSYSDSAGLGPSPVAIACHRLYLAGLAVALVAASLAAHARRRGTPRAAWGAAVWFAVGVALAVAAGLGVDAATSP
jgi:hypothetical protein